MRLDKYISTLTDLSRKDVKAALKYGRISVDGVPARDPAMQVDERTATVTLDGAALMFKRHTHIRPCWTYCPTACGRAIWGLSVDWTRTRRGCFFCPRTASLRTG